MRLVAIRHGPFQPAKGGHPTNQSQREFYKRFSNIATNSIIACSNTPRTINPATSLCQKPGTQPLILPELDPLKTIKYPSLFGGWLYHFIHSWQILNWLALVLWWNGIPVFTEGPIQFLNRIRIGLKILREKSADEIVLVCHQETIIALIMIVEGKRPFQVLRKKIKHFDTFIFEI